MSPTPMKLTAAQYRTIRTILASGGHVVACMGRIRDNRVNKLTIERLRDRGLLSFGAYAPGSSTIDITVTAAGCIAYRSQSRT